jgi:hypothetical protein
MKIYVVGNCQAVSLAACLRVMLPRAEIERLPITHDPAPVLTDGDVVFRQRNPSIAWTLRAPGANEFLYPRCWFNGFHPDFVPIVGGTGAVEPPMRTMHSSLVLFGWHRRWSVSATAELFCEAVYERLHFFRAWDVARRALLEEGEGVGFPLDSMFERWRNTGAFMHSVEHPALTVMADMARVLAGRAGLHVTVDTPEYYLNDPLKHLAVLPVYPEIARRLGVPGAYAFKKAQPAGDVDGTDVIELKQFIEESFAAYAHMDPAKLAVPRLDTPAYCGLGAQPHGAAAGDDGSALERSAARERETPPAEVAIYASPLRMEPLGHASMRAPLDVQLPSAMTARTVQHLPCTVVNEGDAALVTGGEYPVFLCYRWYDGGGGIAEAGNSIHTALPVPLLPGAAATVEMRIAAPADAGRYRLRVALLQSRIAWFDDVDPANAAEAFVDVAPTRAAVRRSEAPAE